MPKRQFTEEERKAIGERLKAGRAKAKAEGRPYGRGKGKKNKDEVRKPSRVQAMLAMCKYCMGDYEDGKTDCGVRDCPIYSWMPYAEKRPNLAWTLDNPKIKGNTVKDEDFSKETNEPSTEDKSMKDTSKEDMDFSEDEDEDEDTEDTDEDEDED